MRPSQSSTSLSKSSLKSSSSSLSPSSSILTASLSSSSSHQQPHTQPASQRQSARHGSYPSNPTLTVPSRPYQQPARNSKLEHIIQNFYTKVAQIIVLARQQRDRPSTRKLNKWFNLGTEDVELLREDLRYWRTLAVHSSGEEPPPMLIEVYVDTETLQQNNVLLMSNRQRVGIQSRNVQRIVLETWELTLNHPPPGSGVDLPSLYKRSIIFFRSLHSLVRLLPCYAMHRHVNLGCRLRSSPARANLDEIPLDIPLLEDDSMGATIASYTFSDVETPLGIFKLNARYRKHCSVYKDVDKDLGAQSIDMDEYFFTPTMVRYRQAHHDAPHSELRERGMQALRDRQESPQDSIGSTQSRVGLLSIDTDNRQQGQRRQSTTSHSPTQSISSTNRQSLHSLEVSTSSLSTRVSPFKSPSLSSSPQAELMLSSTRQTPSPIERSRSSGLDSISSSRKIEFSSSFEKYKNSPSRLETAAGAGLVRRWSRPSDQDSVHLESDEADLEDFMKFVGGNHELKLFQNTTVNQWIESTSLSPASETSSSLCASALGSGSIHRSKKSLSHFRSLKDTHAHLSETLSSSMIGTGLDKPELSATVGTSLGSSSSSSSQGRLHIPTVPSPLHTDHPSISPVHIPPNQHRPSSSNPSLSPSRPQRLQPPLAPQHDRGMHTNLDQNRDHERDPDRCEDRPLGQEHTSQKKVNIARPALVGRYILGDDNDRRSLMDIHRPESQTSLNDGNNSGTAGCGRTSIVDDDDSLVFKMSELESSSLPGNSFLPNDASIVFHRSLAEDIYDTRMASPANRGLRRVNSSDTMSQSATAMMAVVEEEEKSTSSSSAKSEPIKKTVGPPHHARGEVHKAKTLFFADW